MEGIDDNMDDTCILASIIIPVYNTAPYIEECLDSIFVCQKTNRMIEVIVVNDASTDGSLDILNEYRKRHDFILITQESSGAGGARNTGINAAHGKYLLFMDSDDYLEPGSLDALLAYLVCSDADIVEYDYKIINDTERGFCTRVSPPSVVHGIGQDVFCEWVESGFYHGMIWTRAVLRELIVENQLFFITDIYHQDAEWSPKVFAYAKNICYIPLVLYVYRIRYGSITAQKTEKIYMDFLHALVSLYNFSCESWLSSRYVNTLQEKISSRYFSLIYKIKFDHKYNDNMISALQKCKYMIEASSSFHRRYIYKYFIDILGIRSFYAITCGWKDLLKKHG